MKWSASWRTAIAVAAAGLVLAMVVIAFTGRGGDERAIRSGVRVVSDLEPWQCDGTEVLPFEQDDGFIIPVAVMAPEMNCELRFYVENTSDRTVTIESIGAPFLGPGGGTAAVATQLNPTRMSADGPLPGERDAIWLVDDPIEPGDRLHYAFRVEFRPSGCNSAGGTLSFDWPAVTVVHRGDRIAIDADTIRVGLRGSEFSSCDS